MKPGKKLRDSEKLVVRRAASKAARSNGNGEAALDIAIDKAIGKAVNTALHQHKRAGNPVPIWRDGKVVWLSAEQIPVR